MTREEIEELNDTRPYCFETDMENKWYEIGCIDGLNAADAEPDTSELWHPAEEEPEKGRYFLVDQPIGKPAVWQWTEMYYEWENFTFVIGLKRWAYIDDLLPKEGKMTDKERRLHVKQEDKESLEELLVPIQTLQKSKKLHVNLNCALRKLHYFQSRDKAEGTKQTLRELEGEIVDVLQYLNGLSDFLYKERELERINK